MVFQSSLVTSTSALFSSSALNLSDQGEKMIQFNIHVFPPQQKLGFSVYTQLCPTLCDPMDCSLLDSSVHGILQANILECVAIPFSRGSSHQGINLSLPHCRQIPHHLSHQGSPLNTLEAFVPRNPSDPSFID